MRNRPDKLTQSELQQELEKTRRELSELSARFEDIQAEKEQLKTLCGDLSPIEIVLDSAQGPMAMLTEDGRILFANQTFSRASGLPFEQLISLHAVDILPGVSFSEVTRQLAEHDKIDPIECEMAHPVKANQAVEITIRRIPLQDSSSLLLVARQINGKRTTKSDLQLFRRAIEVSLNSVIITAAHGDMPIIMANQAFLDLSGYSSEEVIGSNCRLLQGPDTDLQDVRAVRRALKKRSAIRLVMRNYRKDGTAFWNDLSISPVRNDLGDVTHFVGLQVEVTKSVEARLAESQTAAIMRSLLNSTADGIYGLDKNGNCTFFNKAALNMLGYDSEQEMLGKNTHALVHHHYPDGSDYPLSECHIHRAAKMGIGVHIDFEVFWHKDGRSIPVEYTSDPIIEGSNGGCVVAFRDIREKLHVQAELERQKELAEIASNAKGEFIANMSHEIRTPLTAIMAYSDLLTHRMVDPSKLKYSHAIKRNAQHLLDIINDILDISKIDASLVSIDKQQINVAELIADLASLMAVRAMEKKLPLKFGYVSKIPEMISSDSKRLRQILLNLLSNAIKFTDHGSVIVEVGAVNSEMFFRIEDTGIGIDKSVVDRLFQPFEQASEEITQKYGGTGLGLSISQRLAGQLGGRIEVESKLAGGSKFTLFIPIDDKNSREFVEMGDPATAANLRQHVIATESQNLTLAEIRGDILLVDDLPDVRDSMRGLLELCGANVITAADGQCAIDAVKLRGQTEHSEYDLILMDMNMPVKDGFEATRELRATSYQGPILAVTAGVLDGDRQKCVDAGCDDYLSKPLDTELFLAKITQLIEGSKGHNELSERRTEKPLQVLIVDDSVDVADALSEILELQGFQNRAVYSAAQALATVDSFLPDLCLLDINLQESNGRKLRDRLSRDERLQHTKFIAMTGEVDKALVKELLREGFDQYLAKPVDMTALAGLLLRYS